MAFGRSCVPPAALLLPQILAAFSIAAPAFFLSARRVGLVETDQPAGNLKWGNVRCRP